MLAELLRLIAVIGPQVTWVFIFIAAVVAVFVLYIGIVIWVTLRAPDPEVGYKIFRDLLDLFRRGRDR